MDTFHDYATILSLWRYQHRCRIEKIDSYLSEFCDQDMAGLDAGSGKGPSTAIMSRYIDSIHSIEFEESNVQRQIKNLDNLNLDNKKRIVIKNGDITKIDLLDKSVDIIVCSEVIEHIENYKEAVRELYRVCKPGGRVIFSMPNKLSAFWLYDKLIYYLVRIVRKLKGKPQDRSGYSFFEQSRHWFFSSGDIRDLVKDSGFSIIEESGISMFLFNEWVYRNFCWNNCFSSVHRIETFLANKFSRISAIYFLVLEKKNESENI